MGYINLPYGVQEDSSMIDIYGNRLSKDEIFQIVEQVAGLPATGMKDDIIHAVENNVVTIIDGETGSGKTTQIGKMLFDPKKQIIITQPRVLSAMSNADRVSKELLAETLDYRYSLGHRVGYRTGRGVSSSRISPLSFNTDGLELMRMAYSGLIPDILVLDEVHNFAIPTEIIAMMMKYKKDVKIIIMSATLDSGVFQEYFSHVSSDIPVIKIPGRTHSVTKNFGTSEDYIDTVSNHFTQGRNILFFVPGKREIEDNIELLRAKLGKDAEIFPLHADLPKEEQQKLLLKATDKPRIIVCTNVAEESITIPYIDMVMDLGTHKVARYNNLGIQELRLENTAQANCLQRAGRAGRTKPGEYFRANDASFDELDKYPEAPMEREMLDRYILILLANGIDIEALHEEELLNDRQLFFHNFNPKLLQISYRRLTQIGAIDRTKNITPLGRDLLKFPLDIYHARMLREAIKRKCVDDMIYATAILEKKGFVSKDEKWKEIKMLGSTESDLFGYTELFKFVTSTILSGPKIALLVSLGIKKEELDDFMDREGEYKLYELVDLSPIGVKNKNVKDIDELIMNLRKRLTDSGIEITASSNMNDKKVCIASGSLHNVYKYDPKAKKFQNRDSKTGKSTLYFQAGNVTLVEPTSHHFYLGQPFIIGGSEFTLDLNLLTFLTQVDEGHIHDALVSTRILAKPAHPKPSVEEKSKPVEPKGKSRKSVHDMNKHELTAHAKDLVASTKAGTKIQSPEPTQDHTPSVDSHYESVFKETDGVLDSEQVMREYARLIEKSSRAGGHNNFFQTQEDARMYYLRYRLPDFLIEHNNRIRKYLLNKSEDEIFTFKELLVRFILEGEAYRISLTSIAKTEKSFRHDSIILDRFLESTDPFIRAFRKGEKIILPPEDVELITNGAEADEALLDNREVFEYRKQYARLLGVLGNKEKRVNEDRVKLEVLKEYFQHLELYSVEYKSIAAAYSEMGKMEMGDVKEQVKQLKGVERNTKALKRTQHKRGEIEKDIALMRNLINGNKDVDIQFFFNYKFGEDVSDKYIEKYFNALRLIQSKDSKQRKRGATYLEGVILDLHTQILKLDREINQLIDKTNLSNVPQALVVQKSIEALCRDFFEEDYYNVMVSGKILDATREILRDQINEKKGVYKILFQFFYDKKLIHSSEKKGIFQAMEKYMDTVYELEAYRGPIYREIKDSRDVEEIQSRIKEFQGKIEEFQTRKALLVEEGVAFL